MIFLGLWALDLSYRAATESITDFTCALWMSGESGLNIVCSCLFTHADTTGGSPGKTHSHLGK